MGEQVLVPYLLSIGTKKIDMLVISHGDNDHIGGAHALLAAFPVHAIQTSTPEQLPTPVTTICQAGTAWQWDHVYFKFLHPDRDNAMSAHNNDSCVLLVKAHHHAILLTGDIEKEAEKILLTHQKRTLRAEVLIAPHHGSHTSSTPDFVKAVGPKVVLYATGYLNRYHFPHPQTVATYTALGAVQLNTAETGAIQYKLLSDSSLPHFALYRHLHYHYWMDT
jgi:competence protein ComEC